MKVNMAYVAFATLAGAAGLGSAEISVTLHFDLDGDPFNTAEVVAGAEPVTWTVWASYTTPDPTGYFGGYVGSFVPTGDANGQIIWSRSLLARINSSHRVDTLAIVDIDIFNMGVFVGPDTTNPVPIFTFDFLSDATAPSGNQTRLSYESDGILSVVPDDNIFGIPIEIAEFDVVSDVLVVPGPGAGLASALGACLCTGRASGLASGLGWRPRAVRVGT